MVSSTLKDSLTIEEILKANNVVELLSENTISTISKQILDDYDKDKTSCEGKISHMKDIIDMAKMVAKQKSYPWQGASNVIYPLIANAGIEYGATLYPEIIKDSTVVKAKVIGNDDGEAVQTAKGVAVDQETGEKVLTNIGSKQKQGQRVSDYMNFQLLDEMSHWETDTDKLGNAQPIVGNMYKRVYWDFNKNRPESELIFPDKLIINDGARDIDSCIATHIIELYPQEIMTRIRTGMYIEFDLIDNGDEPVNTEDDLEETKSFNTKLHTFLDQFTWLDLDDDEYPEPYIVTIHEDTGKVVRIIPRFVGTDIKKNSDGKIEEIIAQRELVKYGFIPSPDGSFYDTSFGTLLFGLNESVNGTLNQLFDAGHLSITGGGFIGKGMKVKGGRIALSPGEWKMINVMSDDLAKNIVPIPQPKPDPTLFALLGYLVEGGKNMALLRDVLSGESMGNVTATAHMSMVEQGMKQFKSLYKRYYKSLKTELKLIFELNAKHLTNKKYAEVLDDVENNVDVKQDFNTKNYNICPVADISAITSHQRMAQAQYLMSFVGNPYINQEELLTRILEISQVDNVDKLVVTPPPQGNPAMEVEQLRQQTKMQELQMKMQESQQKLQIEIQKAQAEIEKLNTASMLDMANVSKIGQGIEDADQEREVKVMDNMIDQQTKKIEVQGRMQEGAMKLEGERMKLHGTILKNQQIANKETEKTKTTE
jgi:chaperonin GroES